MPVADLQAGERRLDGASAHYVGRVLRLGAGDAFVAFDPAAATEADATLLVADGDAVVVRFGPTRAGDVAPRRITWIQGLAKSDKCDAVVRDATELGASRVIVARTHRSTVRLDPPRADTRVQRWTRIARDAARQSGRAESPAVEALDDWANALDAVEEGNVRFCLWEQATDPLGPLLLDALASDAPLAFGCGPEGGLEPSEVAEARRRGWTVVSLGRRILRTETVAAAVLGAVLIHDPPLR